MHQAIFPLKGFASSLGHNSRSTFSAALKLDPLAKRNGSMATSIVFPRKNVRQKTLFFSVQYKNRITALRQLPLYVF
jgi:hypothetical protein